MIHLFLMIMLIFSSTNCSVLIRLYTRINPAAPLLASRSLELSRVKGFCSDSMSCTNYLIVHGFNDNGLAEWALDMKDSLLENNLNANVFIVDWGEGAIQGWKLMNLRLFNPFVLVAYLKSSTRDIELPGGC